MDWLDPAELDAIYDAAVAADLVDRDTRTVLLQGVGDVVRLALPDHARPDLQFRSDLRLLNQRPPDGPPPLKAWLAEAAHLAEGRPPAAVFQAALGRPVGERSTPSNAEAGPAVVEGPPESGPASGVGAYRIPLIIGGAAAGLGLLVALIAGGDEPGPDGGPTDAGVAISDAGRADRGALRAPLAVRVAEASRGRPALYRVAAGQVAIEDRGGPRTVRADRDWAWSRIPVTRGQLRATVGGQPPGAGADDEPALGLDVRDVRAYCDALSRAEGRRPFYADGGDGYRLPDEPAWLFTCVGGQGGPPAPAAWGLVGLGSAPELVAVPDEAGVAVRGGGQRVGIAACASRAEAAAGVGDYGFRVVRPLSAPAPIRALPIP